MVIEYLPYTIIEDLDLKSKIDIVNDIIKMDNEDINDTIHKALHYWKSCEKKFNLKNKKIIDEKILRKILLEIT